MNVLSLFDGISCGQEALFRANISVINYFASEVDKYTIKVTNANFPNTKQLGDVRGVVCENLPKIDLLLGGSPCQGFSFAGKMLNFEDPRSKLFFEYVRLLRECKPKYFLLENVRMKKESQDVITEMLGVAPIVINSSLVSAQNRVRLYWTNIPDVTQPTDRGILLRDIIDGCRDGVNLRPATIVGRRLDESSVRRDYDKSIPIQQYIEVRNTNTDKSACLTTVTKDNVLTSLPFGRHKMDSKNKSLLFREFTPEECERLQTLPDGYTSCISKTQRYKAIGNAWTVDVIAHILSFIPK